MWYKSVLDNYPYMQNNPKKRVVRAILNKISISYAVSLKLYHRYF